MPSLFLRHHLLLVALLGLTFLPGCTLEEFANTTTTVGQDLTGLDVPLTHPYGPAIRLAAMALLAIGSLTSSILSHIKKAKMKNAILAKASQIDHAKISKEELVSSSATTLVEYMKEDAILKNPKSNKALRYFDAVRKGWK